MDSQRIRTSFTPVAPPQLVPDMYTPDELERLFGVVRERGPWSLIAKQTFRSAEEFMAVAGGKDGGATRWPTRPSSTC